MTTGAAGEGGLRTGRTPVDSAGLKVWRDKRTGPDGAAEEPLAAPRPRIKEGTRPGLVLSRGIRCGSARGAKESEKERGRERARVSGRGKRVLCDPGSYSRTDAHVRRVRRSSSRRVAPAVRNHLALTLVSSRLVPPCLALPRLAASPPGPSDVSRGVARRLRYSRDSVMEIERAGLTAHAESAAFSLIRD